MENFTFGELEAIRDTFENFNTEGTGYVSLFHAVFLFNKLGLYVTEKQLRDLKKSIQNEETEADEETPDEVNVYQLIQMINEHRKQHSNMDMEQQCVDVFVALGGNQDKSGRIQADKITELVQTFNLEIDIFTICRQGDYDEIRRLVSQ